MAKVLGGADDHDETMIKTIKSWHWDTLFVIDIKTGEA
jgi:hypothetical protein